VSAMSVKTSDAGRLATIRRLYFYFIAFVSFAAMLIAVQSLIGTLFDLWFGGTALAIANEADYIRNNVARDGGLLLVATPIFLIHWAYVQAISRRTGEESVEERTSTLRKLFLYAVAVFTLTLAMVRLHIILVESVSVLVGDGRFEGLNWPGGWLAVISAMIVHLLALLYFTRQLRLDGDLGQELRWAGTLRRLFQTSVGLIGLALALSNGSALLEQGLHALLSSVGETVLLQTGSGWWRTGFADSTAGLVIGILLWWINRQRWEDLIDLGETEARTALRRFYLYMATILSATWTLVPAAGLLNRGLLQIFGVALPAELPDLAAPLSMAPLGLIAWRWHWQEVKREAARYGDSPESATVRRLYYYLVAAIGLILLWLGLVEILRVLLDWLIIGGSGASFIFRWEQMARGISFLVVGAPVWALHWRTVQYIARGQDSHAQSERTSGPRRAYLYGVALLGALLILFDLALALYNVLLWVLGEPNVDIFGTATLDSVVRSGTALVFWIVHVLAIRTDTRLTEANAPQIATEELSTRRSTLVARIEQLEAELNEARATLAVLNADEDNRLQTDE
jgi:hypothetical protein